MGTEPVLKDSCIEITLDGEVHDLVASPEAMVKISRVKGGMRPLYVALNDRDAAVMLDILIIALQLEPKETKGLAAKLFASGVVEVAFVLIRYLTMLENGGRELTDQEEEKPKKSPAKTRKR